MKVTRVLLAVALLATVSTTAFAQLQPYNVRLSWNSCDPYNMNQNFTGPTVYKLVMSCTDMPQIAFSGHDTRIMVDAVDPLPDAWRFDDLGCETGSQIAYAKSGFAKTCPVFQGTAPLGIEAYGLNAAGDAEIRLANTFDAFTPLSSSTRYTMYIVSFDMTYAVVGPSDPGLTCGGAELGLNLTDITTVFLETVSGNLPDGTFIGTENMLTWNGGKPVAAQATSWGRVKGLYR